MPAIHLARLKKQAVELAGHFANPPVFVNRLHALLDLYAEHIHRPGQSGEPPPLLTAYHVPKPVLRQIERELVLLAEKDPEAALALCDALWEQPYLEIRQLAARLLGVIPVGDVSNILHRVTSWTAEKIDRPVIDTLVNEGFRSLRQTHPEALFRRIEDWLDEDALTQKLIGLRALLPVLKSSGFENIPLAFRLLSPSVRQAPEEIRPDILENIRILARRSPRETAYFLRQSLNVTETPDTALIIRRCLPDFPPEQQVSLKAALRAHQEIQE